MPIHESVVWLIELKRRFAGDETPRHFLDRPTLRLPKSPNPHASGGRWAISAQQFHAPSESASDELATK